MNSGELQPLFLRQLRQNLSAVIVKVRFFYCHWNEVCYILKCFIGPASESDPTHIGPVSTSSVKEILGLPNIDPALSVKERSAHFIMRNLCLVKANHAIIKNNCKARFRLADEEQKLFS